MICRDTNKECGCMPFQCKSAPVPPYIEFKARTQRFIILTLIGSMLAAFLVYEAMKNADDYYHDYQLLHQEDGL